MSVQLLVYGYTEIINAYKINNYTLETSNVRLMISASRGWHSNKLREVDLIYASQSKCFRECYL